VCGDPVNYESFVAIGHKRYAVCSDECANKLENDPKRYLAAAQP
jgi:YHS domain-containing protein